MKRLIFFSVLIVMHSLKTFAAAPLGEDMIFEDCRLSISKSQKWKLEDLPTFENNCELTFRKGASDSTIKVKLAAEFLYEAHDLGFDFFNGKWVARGRQGTYEPVRFIELSRWTGIMGQTSHGVHSDSGFAGVIAETSLLLREKEELDGVNIKIVAKNSKPDEVIELVNNISPVY